MESNQKKLVAGIDVGSLTAEAVLLCGPKIVSSACVRAHTHPLDSAREVLDQLFQANGYQRTDLVYAISTGYGRDRIVQEGLAQENLSEISCHGYGAWCLNPSVRTIIDIGGQDAKAIRVDQQGSLLEFVMNDKCAAGTGHFLELMSRTLEVDLAEIGSLSQKARNPVSMSSRCSIFVETEVIHFLQQGRLKADVAMGISQALAERVASLARRVKPIAEVAMTGGVAKNIAVRRELEKRLSLRMLDLRFDPQLVGAYGAALSGCEKDGSVMFSLGCDVGSLFCKLVLLKDGELLAACVDRTNGRIVDSVKALEHRLLAEQNLSRQDLAFVGATGVLGKEVAGADFVEDEVTCIAASVCYYLPGVALALGVGGQSITAIEVGQDGQVLSLARNDKCAAGTGRFLEMMSKRLDYSLDQVDRLVESATDPVEVSNQCVVFAESEAISHINSGACMPDILAGICGSIGRIVAAQGRRIRNSKSFTLVGGVARFSAVGQVVKERLGLDYVPFPQDPMLAAALGAALLEEEELV